MPNVIIETSAPRTVTFTSLMTLLSIVCYLFRGELAAIVNYLTPTSRTVLPILFSSISVALLLSSATVFLYLYLRGAIKFPLLEKLSRLSLPGIELSLDQSNRATYSDLEELRDKVGKVESHLKTIPQSAVLTAEEKARMTRALLDEIEKEAANDFVKQLEAKYISQSADTVHLKELRENLNVTKRRLELEVASLSRRNSLNLTIGAVTTVVAVGLLAYLVLGATVSFENIPNLLAHFIPRVSVAVFIEVFSFFFLRLYKSGLQEIKYFQNELTNIEMKGLALEAAMRASHNTLTEQIVKQLVSTDRNIPAISSDSNSKEGTHLNPKDLASLVETVGKLISSGAPK